MRDKNPPPKLRNTCVEIPEEILFDEILARLPVKSLLRFKCVSKPWRSLIEGDRFIKIHFRYSAKNPRAIVSYLYGETMVRCSLQWLLNKSKEGPDRTRNKPKEAVPVGCCNGVMCFYDGGFTLWNLATRVSVKLPDDYVRGYYVGKCGFGWDESTGAYKVFVVLYDHKYQPTGVLYSSNTNSWRTISVSSLSPSNPPLPVRCDVFVHGNLNWLAKAHPLIERFDLGREEFGRIELPLNRALAWWSWLGVIGGNLSILIDLKKSSEVWVMKEYGVEDSWHKLFTFPTTPLISWPAKSVSTRPLFGEDPNGEIFVFYGETLVIYSPEDDVISWATNKGSIIDSLVYVESLVSPESILGDAGTAR